MKQATQLQRERPRPEKYSDVRVVACFRKTRLTVTNCRFMPAHQRFIVQRSIYKPYSFNFRRRNVAANGTAVGSSSSSCPSKTTDIQPLNPTDFTIFMMRS